MAQVSDRAEEVRNVSVVNLLRSNLHFASTRTNESMGKEEI